MTGTLPEVEPQALEDMMDKIAQMMIDGVRLQFIMGGDPKWTPLKSGEASFLFRGGALLQSIVKSTDQDGEVYTATVSTSGGIPYRFIHQFGGYAGRNHSAYIPERPYMVITEETENAIRREALGRILNIFRPQPIEKVNG